MANWHYINKNGEKITVTSKELKQLALQGIITPETIVETEEGKTAPARKVKGLTFVNNPLEVALKDRDNSYISQYLPLVERRSEILKQKEQIKASLENRTKRYYAIFGLAVCCLLCPPLILILLLIALLHYFGIRIDCRSKKAKAMSNVLCEIEIELQNLNSKLQGYDKWYDSLQQFEKDKFFALVQEQLKQREKNRLAEQERLKSEPVIAKQMQEQEKLHLWSICPRCEKEWALYRSGVVLTCKYCNFQRGVKAHTESQTQNKSLTYPHQSSGRVPNTTGKYVKTRTKTTNEQPSRAKKAQTEQPLKAKKTQTPIVSTLQMQAKIAVSVLKIVNPPAAKKIQQVSTMVGMLTGKSSPTKKVQAVSSILKSVTKRK